MSCSLVSVQLCISTFMESLSFPVLFMLVLMLKSTACLKLAFFKMRLLVLDFCSVVLTFLQCW